MIVNTIVRETRRVSVNIARLTIAVTVIVTITLKIIKEIITEMTTGELTNVISIFWARCNSIC